MRTRELIGSGVALWTLALFMTARAPVAAARQDAPAADPSQLETSVHAGLDCGECHGAEMLPSSDPKSPVYHLNLAATCSRCHNDPKTTAFADSIHGRALSRSGLIVAPTCTDCHGTHDVKKISDPQSRVVTKNVPATCAKCHEGIGNQFGSSVHGRMLASGREGVPACQTCHTAHRIQRAESVGWQLSVIGQCGTCHADRIATFRDTFHGQVTNLGFRSVAGCADCHGAHEILPASDPRSPVSRARLVETCGKCHEDASENFVKYDPHANKHSRQRSPLLYFTAKFMTTLLAGVFGFFGLHSTLWFTKELRLRRERSLRNPR